MDHQKIKTIAKVLSSPKYPENLIKEALKILMELPDKNKSYFISLLKETYPSSINKSEAGYFARRVLKGATEIIKRSEDQLRKALNTITNYINLPIKSIYEYPEEMVLLGDLLSTSTSTLVSACIELEISDIGTFWELIEYLLGKKENFPNLGKVKHTFSVYDEPWELRERYYRIMRPNASLRDELKWLAKHSPGGTGLATTGAIILARENNIPLDYDENWCFFTSNYHYHIYDAEPLIQLAYRTMNAEEFKNWLNTYILDDPRYKNRFELFFSLKNAIGFEEYGEVNQQDRFLMMARKGELVFKWWGRIGNKGRITVKYLKTENKAHSYLIRELQNKASKWNTKIVLDEYAPLSDPEKFIPLLKFAVSTARRALTRTLLKRGVSPYSRDEFDIPIVRYAAENDTELVKAFIEVGMDVNFKYGSTNLLFMSLFMPNSCTLETVKYLIQQGIDVNARNLLMETPLHVALDSPEPSIEIVKILLKAGIDPLARDRNGRTPIDIARNNFLEDILTMLKGGEP